MPRPNVAPRPTCRYLNTPRGCFAGDKCHYLHADPTYTPYEANKTCRFFQQGYCKRGNECWFKHAEPETKGDEEVRKPLDELDLSCGICFDDKPALYGLLINCSHAFCLACIRQWRDPDGKGIDLTDSGIHKTCPMCRLQTKFIVPSSKFYTQDDPNKAVVVETYRLSMARVPCRYFQRSPASERFCPFGKDCFYQHKNEDGTPFIFPHGVDVMMRRRRRRQDHPQPGADPFQTAIDVLEGFVETFVSEASSDAHRAVVNRNFRQILRSMGHVPPWLRPAVLDRLLGEEPDEEVGEARTEVTWRDGWGGGDANAGDESDDQGLDNISSLGGASESTQDTARPTTIDVVRATLAPPHFEPSQDPRAPHNMARPGRLVSGDFAWMMDDRQGRGEGTSDTRRATRLRPSNTSTPADTATPRVSVSPRWDDECTYEVTLNELD